MENGVLIRNVYHGPIGKDALHGLHEHGPFLSAMKIVAHEESTAQEEIAHLPDLAIGELPVPDLHGIQPRVVEDVVGVVQIHRLLDRADVYASQPPQGDGHMPIRCRVIGGPTRPAVPPISTSITSEPSAETGIG